MISIQEIIVVEGKYDKMRLSQTVDAVIVTTDGFKLYKDKEKLDMLRRMAKKRGIIVLTDSDSAGFKIRNYLRQCLGDVNIKHAYIPEIKGKEKRKAKPGREGLLGVEGVSGDIISQALKKAKATPKTPYKPITKARLYEDGLAGRPNSTQKRKELAKKIGMPEKLSANAMLDVINSLYSYDEYEKIIESLQ
jgi:ribonuclease M5